MDGELRLRAGFFFFVSPTTTFTLIVFLFVLVLPVLLDEFLLSTERLIVGISIYTHR